MYSYRKLSQQQLPPVVYSNSGPRVRSWPAGGKKLPNAASSKQSNQANSYFLFPGTPSANQPASQLCVTHQQSPVFSSEAGCANSTGIRSIAKQGTATPEHQMPNAKVNAQNEQMAGKELDLSAMPPHRYVRAGSTTPSFIDNCLDNQPHQPHQFRPRLIYFFVQRSNRVDRSSSGAYNWHKAKAITANMQGKLASQAWSSEAPRTLL
ncbi:hypothetical protein V8C43DRAFT_104239 [Trichoderma afarasin]